MPSPDRQPLHQPLPVATPVPAAHAVEGGLARSAVVAGVVVWGFGPVLVKLSDLDARVFAFYRLWLGFLVMAACLVVARRRLTAATLRAAAPAGLLFATNVVLYFGAVKLTAVADASLIGALQPALVLLVAGRLFGEKVSATQLAWSFVAIGGVVTFVFGAAATPVWSLAGDVLAVGALLTFTGYFLVTKHVRAQAASLEYLTAVLLTAAVTMTPISLSAGQPLGAVDRDDWLWITLFVLGPGTGGHLLVTWAQRYVEVWLSSLIVVGLPVVAAGAALVVLGEPIGPVQLVGGTVVVVALSVIVTRATGPLISGT